MIDLLYKQTMVIESYVLERWCCEPKKVYNIVTKLINKILRTNKDKVRLIWHYF